MSREETKSAKLPDLSAIPPEKAAWLERRSLAFQRVTQRKGMPMTYGAGKGRVVLPPMEERGRDV